MAWPSNETDKIFLTMNADPPNSKLTPAVLNALVGAARKGVSIRAAARLTGISPRTLHRWREVGANDVENGIETSYGRLYTEMGRAEAEVEAEMIACIREAATVPQNWAAAMTFLERRDPTNYGRRDTTVLETDRPLVEINVGDPQTRELVGQLLRRIAGPGPQAQLGVGGDDADGYA